MPCLSFGRALPLAIVLSEAGCGKKELLEDDSPAMARARTLLSVGVSERFEVQLVAATRARRLNPVKKGLVIMDIAGLGIVLVWGWVVDFALCHLIDKNPGFNSPEASEQVHLT